MSVFGKKCKNLKQRKQGKLFYLGMGNLKSNEHLESKIN